MIWKGGGRDDRFDWISMAVPDGNQWIEYMVNTGQPNQPTIRQLGVLNHLALGTMDIETAHNKVVERGYTAQQPFKPSIGRDGRWLMHLYDKDLTRTEFMIRKPVKEPCCSPITERRQVNAKAECSNKEVKRVMRTRRDFVATGLAGIAGLSISSRLDAESFLQPALPAEDGYKLWLRYAPPGDAAVQQFRTRCGPDGRRHFADAADHRRRNARCARVDEGASDNRTRHGLRLLPVAKSSSARPQSSPLIRCLGWKDDLAKVGPEGYIIRGATFGKQSGIAIASKSEAGALYGAFHFLRLVQTAQPLDQLNIIERPKVQLRMVNHWDNMDGTIERGYAGRSLWQWNELPGKVDQRYTDYARAHASVGINATVINSVNANVLILTPEYLQKVKALADVFRPYGAPRRISRRISPRRSGSAG